MTECPACGVRRWSDPRPGGYHFAERHFRRVRCLGCGLVGLDPTPSPAMWPEIYADAFFENYSVHHSPTCGYAAGRSEAQRVAASRLDRIAAFKPSGRLLDIGCAGGHFLAVARDRGYEVLGLEYNGSMATYARESYALTVIQGDLADVEIPGRFDVVHLEDVLEHLVDPLAALRRAHELMAPDGILVIDGPLERQPNPHLALLELNLRLRKVEDPEMSPVHIWQFTLGTQRRLAQRAGFRELEAWVYQERQPATPRTVSPVANFRRSMADRVQKFSVWLSERRTLSPLQLGDRALVVYQLAINR